MPSIPRKRRSRAPGASCPICRHRSTSCRRRTPCADDPERREESLIKAVPRNRRQVYKMRPIIEAVVDKGSFFEIGANFGRPIITGLARLDGRAVLLLRQRSLPLRRRRGPRRPARRWCASSISPRPSICRWSI